MARVISMTLHGDTPYIHKRNGKNKLFKTYKFYILQ